MGTIFALMIYVIDPITDKWENIAISGFRTNEICKYYGEEFSKNMQREFDNKQTGLKVKWFCVEGGNRFRIVKY